MSEHHPAKFSSEAGQAIRSMPQHVREQLRSALEKAEADPCSWPQADRYDADPTVRVVATADAIVHYAVLPGRLWVFAALEL
ncbi:hypothetical protein [Kitasatospora aureofaciens]|uniref:hypothetical protein n=1 Tax=Kitasatospora aureofaciens TaxID=1894 RepID=UPI001C48EDEB|nr:hypothetical protein [Kitasatospora aureofaciens]MBV6701563.1 hypothetical protein [Kitasatospora aureofaciens]